LLLAFMQLVFLDEHLLPQRFGIARLPGGQWACRRPMSTREAIEKGAYALHGEIVTATERGRPCARSSRPPPDPPREGAKADWALDRRDADD
jgi:hypothetical protein